MTREEQLRRQVEVLREALGRVAATDDQGFVAAHALAAADRIAAEPAEETAPAPTWRPIAEMPKEWRDRRAVLCLLPGGDCGGVDPDPVCLRYEGVNWYDDTVTTRCPVLYLDLAIPEVPHG